MKVRLLVSPPENIFQDAMVGNIITAFQNRGMQISLANAYLLWLMVDKKYWQDSAEIDIDEDFDGMWAESDEDEFL